MLQFVTQLLTQFQNPIPVSVFALQEASDAALAADTTVAANAESYRTNGAINELSGFTPSEIAKGRPMARNHVRSVEYIGGAAPKVFERVACSQGGRGCLRTSHRSRSANETIISGRVGHAALRS